ncbi:hypothetical protein FOA43_001866 [Brettanomyces nanus]|uniref:PhoD-like phosphatase domain-containing protein n=1 Tax=Eeniella nana TaxID=13502 RepID=A0A875RZE6_EENNA|nr:uncharacterized protein FOA43_001866 [Brettanomyces nanus]QPG74536.1 hypothetical protein FOA43_001866 [Brettanomyces nanus]
MGTLGSTATWYKALPLKDYQDLVQKAVPEKVNGCPEDPIIGEPGLHVACGPNVRFLGCLENGENNYRASILIVTKGEDNNIPKVSYVIGQAEKLAEVELELSEGQFPGKKIYEETGFLFFRYTVELTLKDYEQKVKYSINGENRPDFQFFLPSVDQSMNIMSYSCNGFSLGADISTFKGSLWLDVLRRHSESHYHVMLGGGDQIYCDSIKLVSTKFQDWLKHKHIHSSWKMTSEIRQSLDSYYLNHYMEWFGKGYMKITNGSTLQVLFPVALHQIPQINLYDDHDIIDGFGSYRDSTMSQEMFLGVGNSAFKYYMLFQHHTPPKEESKLEKSWIEGSSEGGPYIKSISRSVYARLGKEIGFLGLDCRTERTKKQICTAETYKNVFERLEMEMNAGKGQIKHLLVLLGVPICYPRMVWAEAIMESPLLAPIKWMTRKGWILKGLVNEFDGSIELLDDLNDHWCARHHKAERNQLMGRLMKFGANHGVRITILSGDVHLCCLSRFQSKFHRYHIVETTRTHEDNVNVATNAAEDPRLILNLISSAIVNTPPPNGMAGLLNRRSKVHRYDTQTDEVMVPLFKHGPEGNRRSNERFLNQRNYSDLILVKNLSENDKKPFSKVNEGELVYPGPTDSIEKMNRQDVDSTDPEKVAYPFFADSLVATLHVEKNRENTSSETGAYQMLVPPLNGEKVI